MIKILEANGWKLYDKCRCSGFARQEFRSDVHPDLSLFLWPSSRTFRINYRGSSTKVPTTSVNRLEETLETL